MPPAPHAADGSAATPHAVAIVGGGLVGASLAIALDRLGIDVVLVEASAPGTLPPVFDERNLSFAEATVNALQALGVMPLLRAPTGPIRRIHASREGDFGRLRLDAANHGRTAFGQVVVARDFGEALEARLERCRHVRRYRPARFLGMALDPAAGVQRLRLADAEGERCVDARLVVGADGTGSAVREALGIGTDTHDYGQVLFVARVRAERAPDGTAYERLRADGPTALLPRGDGHFGVVHAVAAGNADAVAALDEAAWLARVQAAFGWRVGRLLASGPRSRYPALRVSARALTGPRAALVGNAAQTLHPLGAQGFNLGLRDALTLAERIAEAGPGADPGSEAVLADHVRRRAEDRAQTLAFSDGLARISANPSSLLRPLRAAGLLALDRVPALQAALVGGALGYRGRVPALCRTAP